MICSLYALLILQILAIMTIKSLSYLTSVPNGRCINRYIVRPVISSRLYHYHNDVTITLKESMPANLTLPLGTHKLNKAFADAVIDSFYHQSHKIPKSYVMSMLNASVLQHQKLPTLLRLQVPYPDIDSINNSTTATTAAPGTGATNAASTFDDANNEASFTIFGDTHGQFRDLVNILGDDIAGMPTARKQFLFNGDFVDRGKQSFEVMMTLLMLKLLMPESIHLLRGNHETTAMNKYMGFEAEIMRKYDSDVLIAFRKVFSCLPIAAVVDNECFVVHGGIGQLTSNMTLSEIEAIDRSQLYSDNKTSTILHEFLWADPHDDPKGGFKKSGRGGSISTFGKDISEKFLNKNNLKYLIRSHEVKMNGFQVHHDGRVITVFSAPNYCGEVGNYGAFIRFKKVMPDGNDDNSSSSSGGSDTTAATSSSDSSSSSSLGDRNSSIMINEISVHQYK